MIELSTHFFTSVCITNICVSISSNVIITLGQNYTTGGGGGWGGGGVMKGSIDWSTYMYYTFYNNTRYETCPNDNSNTD